MEKSRKYFIISQQEYFSLVWETNLIKVSDPNLTSVNKFFRITKTLIHILPKHHDAYFKYLTILFTNYTSIKLKIKE